MAKETYLNDVRDVDGHYAITGDLTSEKKTGEKNQSRWESP